MSIYNAFIFWRWWYLHFRIFSRGIHSPLLSWNGPDNWQSLSRQRRDDSFCMVYIWEISAVAWPKSASSSRQARVLYMNEFKTFFCMGDLKIHFLGLFDCSNSVGQFKIWLFRKSCRIIANPYAIHIRHAVSIHERRLKFKPALFNQDGIANRTNGKEVWCAGNHGDVGGRWKK